MQIAPVKRQMLKICNSEHDGITIVTLSGRIEEKDVPELGKLIGAQRECAQVALDLEEVRLVDRQVVRFLAACEAQGMRLKNCPSYVREWIGTGAKNHEPRRKANDKTNG